MDQPGLTESDHWRALDGLARINRWSGSDRLLWPAIRKLAGQESRRPLRLLDIATGAGDVPIRLWCRARRAGVDLRIDGCDVSETALAFAQRQAEARGAEIRFLRLNALIDPLPDRYEIVTSSLFLHHLEEDPAAELLRRMAAAANRLVLVNDLVRSRAGYLLAYVGTRLLSRSSVVHTDGPRSVEGAFTVPEARELAARAGLTGATVERRWPCRFLLSWKRS